jgi:hypothetical protein
VTRLGSRLVELPVLPEFLARINSSVAAYRPLPGAARHAKQTPPPTNCWPAEGAETLSEHPS